MNLDVRSIRRILLPLLAVLVLATGVVACGGDDGTSNDDKNEYINQVNAAQKEFADGVQKLNLSNPSSPQDFSNSLDQLDPLLSGIVSDLEGIEPPEEVQAEHDKLVSSMKDYQKVLTDNKAGLTSGDQAQTQESAQAIATASSSFQSEFGSTVNQINSKLRE
jgi:uncharacterized phage infection (PIP) family protein YhgE